MTSVKQLEQGALVPAPQPQPEREDEQRDVEAAAAGAPVDSKKKQKDNRNALKRASFRAGEKALELKERKVRGFRVPQFLVLLAACVLPISEAATDWSVVIKWYLDGDTGWFGIGLAINLVSGAISGLFLAVFLTDEMKWWQALLLGLLVGVTGLAPPAAAALALYQQDIANGPDTLKQFKALELVFEALPQSILQTYAGVAYGRFDPSAPEFSLLLPVSVAVSLLGAGSTAFGFEATGRDNSVVSLGSRYGVVALLLRTAQAAALIFWIALLGCAVKGGAWWALVLAVAIFAGMVMEAAMRTGTEKISPWAAMSVSLAAKRGSVWPALLLSVVHLGLLGGMAAVFFGDEHNSQGWAGAAVLLAGMLVGCGGCLFAGCTRKVFNEDWYWDFEMEKRKISLCCALLCVPLVVVGTLYAFVTAEHVENNYANKSMPIGGPGSGSGLDDPQYFDCHERTSGLYPAYLATALCVLLTPLYLTLDPELGIKCMLGKDLGEKNDEAERKLRAEVIREDADVPLEKQAEALWKWAEGTTDDGKRWLSPKETMEMAKAAKMKGAALCGLLGAEPIRGPRAVLGGRVGTVIRVGESYGDEHKGKIRVRWEDDGTESRWHDGYGHTNCNWPDDAIKVSDLDETLGVGSAVRHNGRRGTAATEPGRVGRTDDIINDIMSKNNGRETEPDVIQIRWEDDGTLSDRIKVSELEVEVRVGREDFVAACTQHPERTAKMHAKGKADAAVLDAKIAAVWRWADTVADGELGPTELQRLADRVGYNVMVALGALEPIRGPRAVLGGRVGTVIMVGDAESTKGKVRVRWEDDGTESDWVRVSELDEPLGEGSAVRHNGRRGTAAEEPVKGGRFYVHDHVRIRWEDDGTLSKADQYVDELDFDIPNDFSITDDAFAAACRADPEQTARWFEKLRLPLVEKRSCLGDFLAICGC